MLFVGQGEGKSGAVNSTQNTRRLRSQLIGFLMGGGHARGVTAARAKGSELWRGARPLSCPARCRSKAEMRHTCRGTINLATAHITVEDSCNFVISNGGAQTYHLKASSEVERQRWVTALELAKAKAVKTLAESGGASRWGRFVRPTSQTSFSPLPSDCQLSAGCPAGRISVGGLLFSPAVQRLRGPLVMSGDVLLPRSGAVFLTRGSEARAAAEAPTSVQDSPPPAPARGGWPQMSE